MIKYYMRPDSNTPPAYNYCVGEDTDSLWDATTCIEVTEQPDSNYEYDFDTSAWVLNETYYMSSLRSERDIELARTDKYMLSDYQIDEDDLTTTETYRQDLRDCPNETLLADRVMPTCPTCCED